jgi:deferrochelatase/peroxidase EfeB
MSDLSRRRLLSFGAAGAGAAVAAASTAVVGGFGETGTASASTGSPTGPGVIPFTGRHQAGIATPVQDRMHMVTLDLVDPSRDRVRALLQEWTAAAVQLCAGREVGTGAIPSVAAAPPDDTGEASGLPASRLTLTIGFGPGFFGTPDNDPLGLAAQRPAGLVELPRFAGDRLDPARTGGDIVIQACADDPQVAVHAIRNLVRMGFGRVAVRWAQLGFGKTSSTTPAELTPRNLFGFKDGTANIPEGAHGELDQHVWVNAAADGAPAWLDGGSYLVARRIAMHIETWDRTSLTEQERLVGRTKGEGAPLGQTRERDPMVVADLPVDSHVRLAHPDLNNGHKLLRRGYSFVDGTSGLGRLDAGLFFIAFVRNPVTQYIPMQAKLSSTDALQEYLVHTGSGLWAVPPGVTSGGYWGQSLLEA